MCRNSCQLGNPSFFKTMTPTKEQLLEAMVAEQLYGAVEVVIRVPTQWPDIMKNRPDFRERFAQYTPYDYFSEMSPLFCSTEIPFSSIGEFMREHAETHNLSKAPRRRLVGGMRANNLLLASKLLRWYILHGLEITQIHTVIEFTPKNCFGTFVTYVTRTRRAADRGTESKMKADSAKVTGNSAYGSVIMDKTRFRNVRYVQRKQEAKFEVEKTLFQSLTELGNDMYEIEMGKPQIKLDLPIQIGYFILQYAKLRMLEFHYDFLDRFIDRSDYQKLYMDTDSSYISISSESLDDLVKPSMKKTFNDAIYGHCDDSNYLPPMMPELQVYSN